MKKYLLLLVLLAIVCGFFQYIFFETSPKIEVNQIRDFFIISFKALSIYGIVSIILILVMCFKLGLKRTIVNIIIFLVFYLIIYLFNFYMFISKIGSVSEIMFQI